MYLRFLILIAVILVAALTTSCRQNNPRDFAVVRVWSHQGQEAESKAMRAIAEKFNAAHWAQKIRVELTFFPDAQYSEKIAIAAAGRDLPDAFDIDGPLVARYVSARLLTPLDRWISPEDKADFLPTIIEQGTINGKLYALGAFDSATILYYDRSLLAKAGVNPPSSGQGWTWDEFIVACEKLKQGGIEPVSLHMNDGSDEWFTYAFSPLLWSSGGNLIAPDGNTVRNVLASAANIRALEAWQNLFKQGYAAADPVDPDPFGHGTTAMDWSGHWMARSHLAAKGSNLGVMPLPRTGAKPAAPCGSWCWGISAYSSQPEIAALWIRWVTDRIHGVDPIVKAGGAVPARRSAFADFPEYAQPPYSLFREQLETVARSRPHTPFYATLTQRFAAALRDISHGAEVRTRLTMAEREIQSVIDERGRTPNQEPAR